MRFCLDFSRIYKMISLSNVIVVIISKLEQIGKNRDLKNIDCS